MDPSFRAFVFNLLILSLLFKIRNKNQFLVSSEINHIDSRQYAKFQQSSVNLTKHQKGVYYLRVKLFIVMFKHPILY
jgi:hypothetical protein